MEDVLSDKRGRWEVRGSGAKGGRGKVTEEEEEEDGWG